MFIEILKEISDFIEQAGLQPGDKLPSERELAEKLTVGRSSVREALRSLELLGIIETRRGEGTYLKDYRQHHLIELLGAFILKEQKAKEDLVETKSMLEREALKKLMKTWDEQLERELLLLVEESTSKRDFLRKLMELSDNRLLFRIWLVLDDFHQTNNQVEELLNRDEMFIFIQHIKAGNVDQTVLDYEAIFVDKRLT